MEYVIAIGLYFGTIALILRFLHTVSNDETKLASSIHGPVLREMQGRNRKHPTRILKRSQKAHIRRQRPHAFA